MRNTGSNPFRHALRGHQSLVAHYNAIAPFLMHWDEGVMAAQGRVVSVTPARRAALLILLPSGRVCWLIRTGVLVGVFVIAS